MRALQEPLLSYGKYQDIKKEKQAGKFPLLINGCQNSQKAHLISVLGEGAPCRLILTYRDESARELYEDMSFFDRDTVLYPSKDMLFYNADVHSNEVVKQRMTILERIRQGDSLTIVAGFDAILEKLVPFEAIRENTFTLDYDSVVDTGAVRLKLGEMGYESNGLVERPGEYSIRGDIIDIFPLTAEYPVRIELWGEEIDSIRTFHVDSQRSLNNIEKVTVCPATEIMLPKDRIKEVLLRMEKEAKEQLKRLKEEKLKDSVYRLKKVKNTMTEELCTLGKITSGESLLSYFYEETECLLDYLPKDTLIFIDEPSRSAARGEAYENEFSMSMINRLRGGYLLPGQADILYSYEETMGKVENKSVILLNSSIISSGEFNPVSTHDIWVKSIPSYNNSFEQLIKDLKNWSDKKYRIMLMSSSRTRAKRLAEDVTDQGLTAFYAKDYDRNIEPGEIMLAAGRLTSGFEYPDLKFIVLTEKDIFKSRKKERRSPKHKGKGIGSLQEITIGDYVVHEKYGLGIYRGMEQIETEGVARDYINIEYRDDSNLFIPASQLEVIQKYAGGNQISPKLNKLGGNEWEKAKRKVRAQVQIAAKDLVNLYARRQTGEGFVFSQDTIWQKEFEELFPYEETEDQLLAIEETKKDMESAKIMDRLICGDVGYGKTEVAIRAAFKAVMDSKQVAFLVPTTILAQQHYNTFKERMNHYPIEIAVLSRFCSAKEERQIKSDLKKGKIDVVIGTHKLLSKTVEFRDLGLLIIDEEQRFGVKQKEKIKQIKKDVDVLALSATPIPRTLQMSMAGIRDMSLLEIPPVDRRSVQTYVLEYNEELVREAITRELARGGQVYYVYNMVKDIDLIADRVKSLVPDARVEYGHGRMGERQLEDIMMRFINREIDVLVSTTIIETGLDISNANTMIIHNAQMFGLAQLYQLRGRVGRSSRTAYAFLMYQRDRQLKEVAEERLKAIREFTDLGSGFKIAMRDLEIRGAGNLLGAAQSGHMETVGYELYCKMLNDAVKEMKGEKKEEEIFHTSMDVSVDAFIPSDYVENESQKLALYKRIMLIDEKEEAEDMIEELTDRYGDVPAPVMRLLDVVLLRAKAHDVWITAIEQKGTQIRFVMHDKARVKVEELDGFLKEYGGKMKIPPAKEPAFVFEAKEIPKKELLAKIRQIIERIGGLMETDVIK